MRGIVMPIHVTLEQQIIEAQESAKKAVVAIFQLYIESRPQRYLGCGIFFVHTVILVVTIHRTNQHETCVEKPSVVVVEVNVQMQVVWNVIEVWHTVAFVHKYKIIHTAERDGYTLVIDKIDIARYLQLVFFL